MLLVSTSTAVSSSKVFSMIFSSKLFLFSFDSFSPIFSFILSSSCVNRFGLSKVSSTLVSLLIISSKSFESLLMSSAFWATLINKSFISPSYSDSLNACKKYSFALFWAWVFKIDSPCFELQNEYIPSSISRWWEFFIYKYPIIPNAAEIAIITVIRVS